MRVIIALNEAVCGTVICPKGKGKSSFHTTLGFQTRLAPSVLQVSGLKRSIIILTRSEEEKGELEGGSAAGDHTTPSVTSGCTSCPPFSPLPGWICLEEGQCCPPQTARRLWRPAFFLFFLLLTGFSALAHSHCVVTSYKCDWPKLTITTDRL